MPGGAGAFGRGFWQRFRANPGAWFLVFFIAIGLGIFLFGLAGTVGPRAASLQENGDPAFFLAAMAFGTVFVLVALRMLQVTLTETGNSRRHGRRSKGRSPWTFDYPWRPEGMAPDYTVGAGGVLGTVAFLALIALFNAALGAPSYMVRAIVLLFDLLGLVILFDAVLKIVQALRRAHPRMRWSTFPAFRGERLEGEMTTRRPLMVVAPVRVTLRCIRDEWTESKDAEGRVRRELEPWVIWSRTQEIQAGGPTSSVSFAFDLPRDVPGTDLTNTEARYWQTVISVPLTGPDLEVIFLAPVYTRRA